MINSNPKPNFSSLFRKRIKTINVNRRNYVRYTNLYFSDTHAGSETGLLNPETVVEYENEDGEREPIEVQLLPLQENMWKVYNKMIDEVNYIAGDDDVFATHNGDITQGNKYLDQLYFIDPNNQNMAAYYNIRYLVYALPNLRSLRLIEGTSSHSFSHGATSMVRTLLEMHFQGKLNVKVAGHALYQYDQQIHDIAHHGAGPGSRSWLKGNVFRYYLRDRTFEAMKSGDEVPDLYVRSHFHTPIEEWLVDTFNHVRKRVVGIITPSFQGLGNYARQVIKSPAKVTNGGVLVETINNKIHEIHWITETRDVRAKEQFEVTNHEKTS